MDLITEEDKGYILVSKHAHLEELFNRISMGEEFACQFKFSERDFFVTLLELLKINYEDFTVHYYYYNTSRKLHIAESEFGYVWISTLGLVAKNKSTKNRSVNSCLNQCTVISLLLEKAIEVVKDEKVYDVDSYKFGLLSNLSPAIFHNLTFYIEVFCKAYLSLTGMPAPHSHKLSLIYKKTVEAMIGNNHDNSFFQILLLDPLYKFVDHLCKIPGGFKEQYIKYDDNPLDDTVVLFELASLNEIKMILEISSDFIYEYYYMGTQTHYLQSNLYQRMLEKADTDEKKHRIQVMYAHLEKKEL